MTLYAPHTSSQACNLIARRLFLGRPAIMAVCFTAFVSSVVSSSHSNYDSKILTGPLPGTMTKLNAHSLVPTPITKDEVARIVHGVMTTEPTTGEAANHAIGDTTSPAAPFAVSNHPRFVDRPLPDTDSLFRFEHDSLSGPQPQRPGTAIQLASLGTPDIADHRFEDGFDPRMPEAASLSIVPPEELSLRQRDTGIVIDTANPQDHALDSQEDDANRIESIRAIGGETLEAILTDLNINTDDRRATIVALRADNISETLSPDDQIDLAFRENRTLGHNKLVAIRLRMETGREVELRWDGEIHDLWDGKTVAADDLSDEYRPVTTSEALADHELGMGQPDQVFLQGIVRSSLYQAADDAGMTPGEARTLTNIFRYIIDFERDLRVGDRFEVLFDKKKNGDYGDIIYAMIENKGEQITLYRAKSEDGTDEYFDADGKTNKRALMRTPLAYSRISSRYGMRRHPIDGYRKMHRGVDFRARTGTPILAAGDGVVDYVGRRGGYGKYIRIKHNGPYKTAYAHLSRYTPNLSVGKRIKQGDVIGYVGSTGRSTGPHLHFEVLENGKQINPMTVGDFGPVRSLAGRDLARFKAGIARISIMLGQLRPKTVIATNE